MDKWKAAKSPNYETNKDKLYPYSEMPFQDEYKLVMIPICIKNLIEHVDYFGEGRIELAEGTIGFPDCYNVNYEDNLVTEGPDIDRKIPNRIPLRQDSTILTTCNYIKDNSVLIVTVNLKKEHLKEGIVQDIARIVNSDRGKVIVCRFSDEEIEIISDQLKKMKQLYYCPIYLLPDKLQSTYFKTNYRAYLSINELKRELYRNVNEGDVEAAVILTGCLTDPYSGDALDDVVNKLIKNKVGNVFVYAYKVWNNIDKDIVRKHFPPVFQQIFDGDCMVIINKQNNQELVLEPKTMKARGVCHYKSSNKTGWKIIPFWEDNNVLFKLYNIDSDMYLELSSTVEEDEARQVCGAKDSKELRDKFYFEPSIINGQVAFTISNCEDEKQLESPVNVDSSEIKAVLGHKDVGSVQDGRSSWILTASNHAKEKSVEEDQQTLSDEDVEDF